MYFSFKFIFNFTFYYSTDIIYYDEDCFILSVVLMKVIFRVIIYFKKTFYVDFNWLKYF